MDLVKLLQSLEDAIYEIVSWVMLLPKTLIAVTFKPRWAITYINEEWQKKPEERFDGYLSPALLWLFVIAVPNIFLLDIVGQLAAIIGELNPAIGTQINSLEGENRIILGLVFTLLLPVTYLIWIEWIDNKLILKSTLRREFLIQCYIQCATQIPIFLLAFIFGFLGNIVLLSLLSLIFFSF